MMSVSLFGMFLGGRFLSQTGLDGAGQKKCRDSLAMQGEWIHCYHPRR